MQQTQIVIMVIATIGNLIFSWRALRRPRCHGFYRFFVFQSIAFLVPLNLPYWFQDAWSSRQILSWMFLALSILYAVAGFYYLVKLGKPRASARADCNYAFESTSELVESGWYRHIRHPMYGSLLFLAWGAYLKHIDFYASVCIFIASLFVFGTAKTEEKENLARFGSVYAAYMKRTRRFIPFIL